MIYINYVYKFVKNQSKRSFKIRWIFNSKKHLYKSWTSDKSELFSKNWYTNQLQLFFFLSFGICIWWINHWNAILFPLYYEYLQTFRFLDEDYNSLPHHGDAYCTEIDTAQYSFPIENMVLKGEGVNSIVHGELGRVQ